MTLPVLALVYRGSAAVYSLDVAFDDGRVIRLSFTPGQSHDISTLATVDECLRHPVLGPILDAGTFDLVTTPGTLEETDTTTGIKYPVRVATAAALAANTRTGNVLQANANGAMALTDGIALAVGDRLLAKDEVAGANRGIYTVTSLGSGTAPWRLTRATDCDDSIELVGGFCVPVLEGTVNNQQVWQLTTTGAITINVTALTFTRLLGLLPALDTTIFVQNAADPTRQLRFDAATIGAGTTRVLTMANQNVSLVPNATFLDTAGPVPTGNLQFSNGANRTVNIAAQVAAGSAGRILTVEGGLGTAGAAGVAPTASGAGGQLQASGSDGVAGIGTGVGGETAADAGAGGQAIYSAGDGGAGTSAGAIDNANGGLGGTAWLLGGSGGGGADGAGAPTNGVGGPARVEGGVGGAGTAGVVAGNGGAVLIAGGAAGANGGAGGANGGNASLDAGAATGAGTSGSVAIGGTTAVAVNVGRAGQATNVLGDLTVAEDQQFTREVNHLVNVAASTAATTAGGNLTVNSGAGTPAAGGAAGGIGGVLTVQAGAGGAAAAGAGAAGAGSAFNLTGSSGGAGTATGTAGAGGNVAIAGGAAGVNGGAGGANGGNASLDAGAGSGAGTNGTLTVGGTNALSVAVGRSGVTTTINGTSSILSQIRTRSVLAADSAFSGAVIGAATETAHTPITLASADINTARRTVRYRGRLTCTDGAPAGTWQVQLKLGAAGVGGVLLANFGAIDPVTGTVWYFEGELQIRTIGGGGTFTATTARHETVGAAETTTHVVAGALDTTVARNLTVTSTCSTANAVLVQLEDFQVEVWSE